MNREIKFRGLRTDGKGWVYGYLIPRSILTDPFGLEKLWIATGFEDEVYPVIESSIGQFTGLKDKNGVEIYEGDKIKAMGSIGQVYYCNDTCMFMVRFLSSIWSFDSIDVEIEIIGNIHESSTELKEE